MRARVAEQEEGEGSKACVGICYYNKLVALEAKEDLTRHNEVYKQVEMRQKGKSCHINLSNILFSECGCAGCGLPWWQVWVQ